VPKDINILDDENIFIHFFLGDFEFSTQIDFAVFYKESEHSINVYKSYIDGGRKKKSLVKVTFVKDRIRILEEAEKISLKTLDNLYERVIDLHIRKEFDGHNIHVINSLLESLDKELYKEFDYIFETVMTFIAKLGKFNVINNYQFPESTDNLIKIDRIITVDA
jgi:hypothetical protein